MGYRWYDAAEKPVAFPFGHGLSYTSFSYSDLEISKREISLTVTNTGSRAGKEPVQLYLGKPDSSIYRAPKELKAYQKIHLSAGESQRLFFTLSGDDLSVYADGWKVEHGLYQVIIGSSSRDIQLCGEMMAADAMSYMDSQKF